MFPQVFQFVLLDFLFSSSDKVDEVKPKSRAAPKKAPAKKVRICQLVLQVISCQCRHCCNRFSLYQQQKSSLILKDDDATSEDEVHDLKERLAAYNLDSSPDQSEGK